MGVDAPWLDAVGQSVGRHYWRWLIGTVSVSVGLMMLSLHLAPFEMLTPDFSPTSSEVAAREDAREQTHHGMAMQTDGPQDQQAYSVGQFMLIFSTRDGNQLLRPEMLSRMREIEDTVVNYPGYTEVCKWGQGSKGTCELPGSIVNFLYPSSRSIGGDTLITVPDRQGTLVADPPAAVFNASESADWLLKLLPDDQTCTQPPHTCSMARTFFQLGGPLEGYSNLADRKAEQKRLRYQFLEGVTHDVLWPLHLNTSEVLGVTFSGDELWRYELSVYMFRDSLMAGGSLGLLFAYFVFHTGSLLLALSGVLNIGLSFPISYFVYRSIFGFRITGLTIMAMFVVLGIGADDVFIVVDTWKRSLTSASHGGLGLDRITVPQRAGWVLAHAASAMAITSATTISAFMTSALSRVPVIQQFGFFAACVVGANFVLVCTFFLASTCVWEANVRGKSGRQVSEQALASDMSPALQSAHKRRRLEVFFHDYYVPFANDYRRLILLVFTLLVGLSGFIGAHFQIEDTAADMLPPGSNIAQFRQWNDRFPVMGEVNAVHVHFVWGVVGLDRTTMDLSDPDDHGTVLLDGNFDLWQDQQAFVTFCDSIKAPSMSGWTTPTNAACSMAGFRSWRVNRNLSFPVTSRPVFFKTLAEYLATPEGYLYAGFVGFDESGSEVAWIDIPVVSALKVTQKGAVVHDHYNFWEHYAQNINEVGSFTAPVYQTSSAWEDMITLDSLAKTAVLGIICSLSFATACMLVVTQQWRLTMFATITIAAIVITLVAAYVLMGRTLGFMESVNLAIVSGLAVDYTLHIAHLYQHSSKTTRFERTQEALGVIGISIFSGAATTLLASSMLFAAYIKMSQAFGATIFLSIAFSFMYAMGLFVPLLLEYGPLPPREVTYIKHAASIPRWTGDKNGDTMPMLSGPHTPSAPAKEDTVGKQHGFVCSRRCMNTWIQLLVTIASLALVFCLVFYAIDPTHKSGTPNW